jgi:glycosyltransferase involved in cell wall biosynthesis
VVIDGETGILIERGDSDALAAAIAKLLADPHLRERMGAAGRERVRQLFTWERSIARLEDLYGGVLEVGTADAKPAGEHIAHTA